MNRIGITRACNRSAPRAALLAAALSVAPLLLVAAHPARAIEVVPSVGLTRAVDVDQVKSEVGLALRGPLVPGILQTEVGASYRSESRFDGDLKVRQWPITASLWLTPVPALYAGGGVGWYNTSYDYQPPIEDETRQQFGVHVGGGIKMPLAPAVALDLGGRYVFMHSQESKLVPDRFDPDFWTMSLGLAFGL
jgi:Outer membrane protein beta-barrel domain